MVLAGQDFSGDDSRTCALGSRRSNGHYRPTARGERQMTLPRFHVVDMPTFKAGAFYVMDRGYVGFERLYALH